MPFPFPGVEQQVHTFRDAKGFTAQVRYFINVNAGAAGSDVTLVGTILTQLKLLTNAAYQGSTGPFSELGPKQYGTAAAYASARMSAKLRLQDADGGLHSFGIPAPKLGTVFDADEQTVLPSGVAALTALITNASAPAPGTPYVSTRSGLVITNFMGGFFQSRNTKRNKLFFLDAQLTPSEPGD